MATERQKFVALKMSEIVRDGKPMPPIGYIMLQAGYSEESAKKPYRLKEAKGFRDLLEENGLDDASLAKKHQELLNASRIDHMVFPTDEEALPDDEIRELLASVNCKVRRIVHGETARHVYFWASDNKARLTALDMGYKLKGSYAPEKKAIVHAHVNMNPKTKAIADRFEEELKKTLME